MSKTIKPCQEICDKEFVVRLVTLWVLYSRGPGMLDIVQDIIITIRLAWTHFLYRRHFLCHLA